MGSVIRRWQLLIIVAMLVTPLTGVAQKPTVVHTVDYINPPNTLEALWRQVDAVLLAQVESSAVWRADVGGRVATTHTVRLLEVFKGASGIGSAGTTLDVVQAAGELELGDRIVSVNGGFPPARSGERYVMFLEWNGGLSKYELAHGPFASFKVNGALIETPAVSGPAVKFRGSSLDEFLKVLRQLK